MRYWMHARPLLAALACICLSSASTPSHSTPVEFAHVDAAVIQHRLESVSRKLVDRKAALEALFHEVGCEGDNFKEEPVRNSAAPNLVCVLPGETVSEIVVGGHFDSIEAGMGAVDDWSGSSMLPSLYQSLKSQPRHHRFVFVAFAAEERGLLGSREFVRVLPAAEKARVRAMINLECLGLGYPRVWASRADRNLLNAYALVADSLHMEARGMNVENFGDDDSHPFLSAGIPVLTIHSLTRETLPILHTKRDTVAAIHPNDYYTAYQLIATYLAYLDSNPTLHPVPH